MSESAAKPAGPNLGHEDWRSELMDSLRDCGVQRAPRFAFVHYIIAVFAFGTTVLIGWGCGLFIETQLHTAPPWVRTVAWGIYYLFAVFVLARVRNMFLRRAWQSSARSAEDELARRGARRPIFYLRSFGLDKRIGRPSIPERLLGTRPMNNVEQFLTRDLREIGPVIAIGRPDEKLPALGAARFYVAHDLWQQKVAEVLPHSQLVVWATGVTEGLGWEISHLVENVDPQKIIIWAHPHLLRVSPKKREAEWAQFRQVLGDRFPKPMPETLGETRFIVFDKDWNPIPVGPDWDHVFTRGQTSAIRKALQFQEDGLSRVDVETAGDPAREVMDLGGVIGARGEKLQWPLLAAFAAALFLGRLTDAFRFEMLPALRGSFLEAIVTTVAAAVAFRYLKSKSLAALAAAAGMTLFYCLWNLPIWLGPIDGILIPFLTRFIFFGAMAYAIFKITPLALALWVGAVASGLGDYLLSLLEESGRYGDSWRPFTDILGATIFALCFALCVKFLYRSPRHQIPAKK